MGPTDLVVKLTRQPIGGSPDFTVFAHLTRPNSQVVGQTASGKNLTPKQAVAILLELQFRGSPVTTKFTEADIPDVIQQPELSVQMGDDAWSKGTSLSYDFGALCSAVGIVSVRIDGYDVRLWAGADTPEVYSFQPGQTNSDAIAHALATVTMPQATPDQIELLASRVKRSNRSNLTFFQATPDWVMAAMSPEFDGPVKEPQVTRTVAAMQQGR